MTNVPTGVGEADLETWENISRSRFVLKRVSALGQLTEQMIGGRTRFHVTPQERRVNMELAADASLDPFRNGMFTPVRILETTEDAEQIASNPNVIAESDMVDLVKGKVQALRDRIETIENPIVLSRLLEVAKESDATMSKIDAIQARLDVVQPATHTEVIG